MPHGSIESPTAPTTDWLVTQHALGRLPRAASVLAEAYLELNPQKRAVAARIEDVGGYLLETTEPVSLGSKMDDAALVQQALPDGPVHDSVMPPSLAEIVGQPAADLAWKWRARGAYEYRLKELEDNGIIARLLRIEPGRAMPQHTHGGLEATLVLQGAFRDDAGRFGPGDVELADNAVDHRPIAEPGDTCICFAVNEAPMRLTGPFGRVLQSLFQH